MEKSGKTDLERLFEKYAAKLKYVPIIYTYGMLDFNTGKSADLGEKYFIKNL